MAISSISAELAYLQSDEPNDRLDWINTFKAALCNIWPLEVRKWLTSKQQWHTNSILKASLSKHSKHTIFGCLFVLLPNQTHHQNSQWFQGTRSNCHCIYSQITCQEPYIACRTCFYQDQEEKGQVLYNHLSSKIKSAGGKFTLTLQAASYPTIETNVSLTGSTF